MPAKLIGLIVGPVILIALGFVFFGQWGAIIGLFIGMAAMVFVPLFGIMAHTLGVRSLWGLAILANVIPLGWAAMNCLGRSCPNYTLESAAPMYVAATFCAFLYWLVTKLSRKDAD